jgi:hypothetical protein
MTTDSQIRLQPASPGALHRTLRIGVYFAALSLFAGVFIARRASAELSERSHAFARRLDSFQELAGRVTRLSWNGEELGFSTLLVKQPVEQVLARFVELCGKEQGSVASELSRSAGVGETATGLLDRVMVVRDLFEDGSGTGVCLAGLGEGGLRGLYARARSFTHSGDLAELGQLRFARFRTTEQGHTHVLLVTSDGPLRIGKLLPHDGSDADGGEAIEGTRPLDSTRVLVARTRGTPHGFTAYHSRRPADEALSGYGQQLRARGYAPVALPGSAEGPMRVGDAEPVLTEAYRNGPEAFIVTAQADDTGSVLSVVQLGALPIPGPDEAADVGRSRVGRGRLGAPRDPAFE